MISHRVSHGDVTWECLDSNNKINYINHGLIRLKKFICKVVAICTINYFFSLYLILHSCV